MKVSGLFPLTVWLFIASCMCTPPADRVANTGITIGAPSIFSVTGASKFLLILGNTYARKEGKKGKCLTYNKEMAQDIVENPFINESFKVACNRAIDTIPAGNQLLKELLSTNGGNKINAILEIAAEHLQTDSIYIFTFEAATTNGNKYFDKTEVLIKP